MESLPGKRPSGSSRYMRWSRVNGGRYAPIRGVHCNPETISQLTMFGQLNCMDSMYKPPGLSLMTIPTPPGNLQAAVGKSLEHT